MPIATKLVTLARCLRLKYELRRVEQSLRDVPAMRRQQLAEMIESEMAEARQPMSDTSGLETEVPTRRAGDTRLALERMSSPNRYLRMRGIALWLTVAFFETAEAQRSQAMTKLHRQLNRLLARYARKATPARAEQRAA